MTLNPRQFYPAPTGLGEPRQANAVYAPLHEDPAEGIEMQQDLMDVTRRVKPREGWVPTFDVTSTQPEVETPALEHLVKHSTGLDAGNVEVVNRAGNNHLIEGNHRMNAALRRGQLFVPADIYDD